MDVSYERRGCRCPKAPILLSEYRPCRFCYDEFKDRLIVLIKWDRVETYPYKNNKRRNPTTRNYHQSKNWRTLPWRTEE